MNTGGQTFLILYDCDVDFAGHASGSSRFRVCKSCYYLLWPLSIEEMDHTWKKLSKEFIIADLSFVGHK